MTREVLFLKALSDATSASVGLTHRAASALHNTLQSADLISIRFGEILSAAPPPKFNVEFLVFPSSRLHLT